jgi:PAS domain S-box-containing protein
LGSLGQRFWYALRREHSEVSPVTTNDDRRSADFSREIEILHEILRLPEDATPADQGQPPRQPALEPYLGEVFEGIAVLAPDGRIRLFTPGFVHISGYRMDELEDMHDLVMKLAPDPETGARQWAAFEAGLGLPESQEQIVEIVNKRGEHRVLRERLYRANEDTLVHVLDITAIHNLRAATPYNAEHYQVLLDNLGIGVYSIDDPAKGSISFSNKAFQRILGIEDAVEPEARNGFMLYERPQDRVALLRALMADKALRSRTLRFETRLLRLSDRQPVPLRITATVSYEEDGRMSRIDGAVEDLGERERLEAERAHTGRLLGALFRDTAVGVAIGTLDGRITAVNPAYCALVGYSEEELLGHEGDMVTHPDDHGKTVRAIQAAMVSGRHMFSFEKRYVHKDGTVFPVSVVMAAVRDEAGQVVAGIGLFERIG